MHVLRVFLTSSSAATRGGASARRCIRVFALPKQPSLRISVSLDSGFLNHPAALSLLSASPPSLDSISDWHSNPIAHRVRRKRQRLPPSLLIENASDRHFSSTQCVLPEAFPIKPSDKPSSCDGPVRSEPQTVHIIRTGSRPWDLRAWPCVQANNPPAVPLLKADRPPRASSSCRVVPTRTAYSAIALRSQARS